MLISATYLKSAIPATYLKSAIIIYTPDVFSMFTPSCRSWVNGKTLSCSWNGKTLSCSWTSTDPMSYSWSGLWYTVPSWMFNRFASLDWTEQFILNNPGD